MSWENRVKMLDSAKYGKGDVLQGLLVDDDDIIIVKHTSLIMRHIEGPLV